MPPVECHATGSSWRKSRASGQNQGCVEIASVGPSVLVRDSKDSLGPQLAFGPEVWSGFLAGIRRLG